MSHGRFSFDNDDEASFAPRTNNAQPEQQFQSARGRDYQVSSAHTYAPRELSPATSYHDDVPVARSDHDRPGAHNLMDSSPSRQPYHMPPPLEQTQRDPHDPPAPIPPPHRHMSSDDSGHRGAAYGAAAGFGGGAAMDTSYHGAADYPDYQPYNPFEHADRSSMQAPAHGYPEYPQSSYDDPFASNRNSYSNLAVPPSSYEMQNRPGMGSRPDSFSGPYGTYDHAASSGDLGSFDPRDIADEEDDTGALANKQKHRGAAAAGIAGTAGAAAAAGGFIKGVASRDASGKYGAVPGGEGEKGMNVVGKKAQSKRLKWIVAAIIVSVIVLACIGGGVGAYYEIHKNSGSGSSSGSGSDSGGEYDANSSEIKKLLNNKDLHRVFPGMDYTPFNAQYPDCLSNMPSQNNVTMDVAVLSQLTPQIRLYGTDCKQVDMVLTAIDKLNMKNKVKVWLGIYLDGNQTTNDRQVQQMWDVLDKSGPDQFQGVIVGNEVLFSDYMPKQDLINTVNDVKKNLTSKNIKLPIGTSDLGSKWDEDLAQPVDYVMANVHPFFGGVGIDTAASWTYSYWQDNDVAKTNNPPKKQVISEVGWPTGGGNYCTNEAGSEVPCANAQAGAVASIDNLNKFMSDWVCPALKNGTQYFWFEAFDEPWKIKFNKPGQDVEDKWGLMYPDRTMKPGVQIPDCGGQQASLP